MINIGKMKKIGIKQMKKELWKVTDIGFQNSVAIAREQARLGSRGEFFNDVFLFCLQITIVFMTN